MWRCSQFDSRRCQIESAQAIAHCRCILIGQIFGDDESVLTYTADCRNGVTKRGTDLWQINLLQHRQICSQLECGRSEKDQQRGGDRSIHHFAAGFDVPAAMGRLDRNDQHHDRNARHAGGELNIFCIENLRPVVAGEIIKHRPRTHPLQRRQHEWEKPDQEHPCQGQHGGVCGSSKHAAG